MPKWEFEWLGQVITAKHDWLYWTSDCRQSPRLQMQSGIKTFYNTKLSWDTKKLIHKDTDTV